MATTVNLHEDSSQLSALVNEGAQGEDVDISRYGKPVARLTALKEQKLPLIDQGETREVSAANLWKIAIRVRLGRLEAVFPRLTFHRLSTRSCEPKNLLH